ncbi:SH3 domain-containing protein [Vreelandella alkaliphila]|uniref:SH3 domain-containing protein n=1 Tax=Vreelandella alkaliphila TaxID=272774 RepID=UPI003FD7C547
MQELADLLTNHTTGLYGVKAASEMRLAMDGVLSPALADLQEHGTIAEMRRAMDRALSPALAGLNAVGSSAAIRYATEGLEYSSPLLGRQNLADLHETGATGAVAAIRHFADSIGFMDAGSHFAQDLWGTRSAAVLSAAEHSLKNLQGLLLPSFSGLNIHREAIQGLHEMPHMALLGVQASQLSESHISPLIRNFAALSDLPFDKRLIETALDIASYVDIDEIDGDDNSLEQLKNVEQELKSSPQGFSYNSLSPTTQAVIVWLLLELVSPFLINISSTFFYNEYLSRADSYGQITSSREVRKITKCTSHLERESLSHCRVVSRNGIALRSGPSQKSDTIANVSIGTTIAIIDDSNRTWLQVEILSEEVHIEGWMLRRYTEKFR